MRLFKICLMMLLSASLLSECDAQEKQSESNQESAIKEDREATARGRQFLVDLLDPRRDLLPEFRGHNVIWLYHDNYLAAKVLARSHPELSDRIIKAIRSYGVERSGKIELLFGESELPLRRYELRDVSKQDGFTIRSEFTTKELMNDPSNYADLLFFLAIAEPDLAAAKTKFEDAMKMWDGIGFKDKASKSGKLYATYKLALAMIAARRFQVTSPELVTIRQRLIAMQSSDGGWITDYRPDLTPVGFANVETTCLAILGLETKP